MKCNFCGREFNGEKCPACGSPASGGGQQPNNQFSQEGYMGAPTPKKWYMQTGTVVLLLLFFWPAGLVLMWKFKKEWHIAVKIIITAVIFLLAARMVYTLVNINRTPYYVSDIQEKETEDLDETDYMGEPENTTTVEPVTSDSVPEEYNQAIEKAYQYSRSGNMSKAAIYDILTSGSVNEFSAEAAQYAIDNLQADYNANALNRAKVYKSQGMSPEEIRKQLTSEYAEKFTAEEADYAITNLGQ